MSKSLERIGAVASATLVSRFLGLARDILITAVFGTSALASAFATAFTLPNLFRRLLGEGSLTAALVPMLNEELEENGRRGAFALVNQVTTWLGLVTLALVGAAVVLFVNADEWLRLWQSARGATVDERWFVGARLAALLFPYLIFVCLAAAISAALNVLGRFTEAALSPIWLNLAMIGSLGGLGAVYGETAQEKMLFLCGGVLVGGALQLAVPAWVLRREGWRPQLNWSRSVRLREIARLMGPGLFGVAIYQVNILVSRLLAFSLNDSAAVVLHVASRVMELPIGIFAVAVATVVFPTIARHAARRDYQRLAEAHRKGIRLILVITVPAGAGLAILSEPIIRFLFQRGEFTAADTAITAPVLALFALGLPFFSFVTQVTRAFYSLKDTVTPVRVAFGSLVLNAVLSIWLMQVLSTPGLALASTLTVALQAIVLQVLLVRQRPELRSSDLVVSLGKIAAATAGMAAAVGFAWLALRNAAPGASWLDLAAIFGLIPAGGLLYALSIWLLRIEGRDDLAALVQRWLRRPAGQAGEP